MHDAPVATLDPGNLCCSSPPDHSLPIHVLCRDRLHPHDVAHLGTGTRDEDLELFIPAGPVLTRRPIEAVGDSSPTENSPTEGAEQGDVFRVRPQPLVRLRIARDERVQRRS